MENSSIGKGRGVAPSIFNKLPYYVIALRPWSFTASFSPVIFGSVFAYKMTGEFNVILLILTILTIFAVHGAGNVVNTYYDYIRGVDNQRSDDRTLVDHLLTEEEVVNLGALLYICGCIGFTLSTWLSNASLQLTSIVYFGGLSASFLYTGGVGFKYMALGDPLIVISFGPICVLFSYLISSGQLSWTPLLLAIPLALNTEAILHANNTRDRDSDMLSGIVTLAILLGPIGSYLLFCLLLFLPYLIFFILALHYATWLGLPILTIPVAFHLERLYRAGNLNNLPRHLAKLNLIMGILYTCGIMLTSKESLVSF